ncbi:MAG: hypothetical protein IVW56_01155 [Candidatus Binataceae bacterium]|nr:hypothetical protein [Candidatus Binataceae bacterium]
MQGFFQYSNCAWANFAKAARDNFAIARTARFSAAILALTIALMVRPALAQSDDPSLSDPAMTDRAAAVVGDADYGSAALAAPADDLATPPPSEPPVASAPSYASDPPAGSDGSASAADATAPDSSSGPPSEVDPSASSDASAAAHSGWIRTDDSSAYDGSDAADSVLELPQVVDTNPADGNAPNNPAAAPGDAAQTANAGDDGDADTDMDADADSGDAIDQYQAQVNAAGPIYIQPVLIQPQIVVPYGFRPVPQNMHPGWMNRMPMAGGYNFRPRINSMNGAFTPTSPMLMPARGPSLPGAWGRRAR